MTFINDLSFGHRLAIVASERSGYVLHRLLELASRRQRAQLFARDREDLFLVELDLKLSSLEEITLVVRHQDGQLYFHLSFDFFEPVVVVNYALPITLPTLTGSEYLKDLGFSRPQVDFIVVADQQ